MLASARSELCSTTTPTATPRLSAPLHRPRSAVTYAVGGTHTFDALSTFSVMLGMRCLQGSEVELDLGRASSR